MNNFKTNYIAAVSISFFGNGMHFVAITWLIYSLTNSINMIGIIIGLCFIPRIVVSYFYQNKMIKVSEKKGMIISDLLRFIITISLPISFWIWGYIGIEIIFLVEILNSALSSVFSVSSVVMLKNDVKSEELENINRKKEIFLQVSLLLGSVLSGVVILYLSAYLAIFINAITFLLSAILINMIRRNSKSKIELAENHLNGKIISKFKIESTYKLLIVGTLIVSLPAIIFDATMTEVASKQLGGNGGTYAFLETGYALGAFLTIYLATSFRRIVSHYLNYLMVLLALLTLCIALIYNFYIAMLLCIALGYAGIVLKVYYQTMLQIMTPAEHMGSAQGFIQFTQNIFSFIGFIAIGLLAWYCSNQSIILIAGVFTLTMTVVFIYKMKKYLLPNQINILEENRGDHENTKVN